MGGFEFVSILKAQPPGRPQAPDESLATGESILTSLTLRALGNATTQPLKQAAFCWARVVGGSYQW